MKSRVPRQTMNIRSLEHIKRKQNKKDNQHTRLKKNDQLGHENNRPCMVNRKGLKRIKRVQFIILIEKGGVIGDHAYIKRIITLKELLLILPKKIGIDLKVQQGVPGFHK